MGSQYTLPENGRIRVLSASGSVTVIAEERSDVDVEPANRTVELKEGSRHRHRHRHGHGILDHFRKRTAIPEEDDPGETTTPRRSGVPSSKSSRSRAASRCAVRSGTDVSVGAMSGSVKLIGTFGSLKISTVSGGIEIDTAHRECRRPLRQRQHHRQRAAAGARTSARRVAACASIVSKAHAHASTISGGVEIGTVGDETSS